MSLERLDQKPFETHEERADASTRSVAVNRMEQELGQMKEEQDQLIAQGLRPPEDVEAKKQKLRELAGNLGMT